MQRVTRLGSRRDSRTRNLLSWVTSGRRLLLVSGSQSIQSSRSLSRGAGPDQHRTAQSTGYPSSAMVLVNSLPNGVSSRSTGLEVVLVIEGGAKLIDLELLGGVPDFKGLGERIERRANVSGYHDAVDLAIFEQMFSEIQNIPSQ